MSKSHEFDERIRVARKSDGSSGESDAGLSVEQATASIRDAIADGSLAPGSRIKIGEAASSFGFGIMPIREALRKLEGEGLVQIVPNRGATVREIDRKFLEDIYEVRIALEDMTVQKCFVLLTIEKLDRLEGVLELHKVALAANDFQATVRTSRQMHATLFEFAGNKQAERIFDSVWQIIHTLRLQLGYSSLRKTHMAVEYTMLIDALREHNLERARNILRMHHQAGMEDLLAHFEQDRLIQNQTVGASERQPRDRAEK